MTDRKLSKAALRALDKIDADAVLATFEVTDYGSAPPVTFEAYLDEPDYFGEDPTLTKRESLTAQAKELGIPKAELFERLREGYEVMFYNTEGADELGLYNEDDEDQMDGFHFEEEDYNA